MKIRRRMGIILIALVIVVTNIYNVPIWANVSSPELSGGEPMLLADTNQSISDHGRRAATSSSADKEIIDSVEKATGSNALLSTRRGIELPYDVTLTEKLAGNYYWGDPIQLMVTTSTIGQVSWNDKIRIVAIDEGGKEHVMGNLDVLACRDGKDISYEKLDVGTYRIVVLDRETSKQVGDSEIEVTIYPAAVEVTLMRPIIYSRDMGESNMLIAQKDAIITNNNGTSLWEGAYVLCSFESEGKENTEPGCYDISGLQSLQSENVVSCSLRPSENNKLYRPRTGYLLTLTKEQVHNEQEIQLDIIRELIFPETNGTLDIIMGELKEEDKEKFKTAPAIVESVMKFTVSKDTKSMAVEIPLTVKMEGYDDHKLTVQIEYSEDGYKGLIGVKSHTEEEIKNFLRDHPFNTSKKVTYKINPDEDKFQAGELSDETVQDGLNALNFMRFIAGLDSNITSDAVYQSQAQAGSLLLDIIGSELNHFPEQPSGVPDSFYQLGYQGTSHSNLGRGFNNISDSIINGYMYDGDEDNIAMVGHRLWCLDELMRKTGFGYSGNYTAMYVNDGAGKVGEMADTVWPGLVMPYEYFKGPWHVGFYAKNYSSTDKTTIRMKGLTSGKSCVLDKSCQDINGKYFLSHGVPFIIFQPDVTFSPDEEVEIIISGLTDDFKQGSDIQVRYTTKFFSMGSSGDDGSSSEGGSSSGGGGGSSSGGGGGGGSHSGGGGSSHSSGGAGKGPDSAGTSALPDYVVKGTWTQLKDMNWCFTDSNGVPYRSKWAAIENPYANTASGQSAFDWFYFDANGNMVTGWYQEGENLYYLNQNQDGTRGRMVTGWFWIPDQNGIQRCYYFNPVSDGTRGKLIRNKVIDGNTVNNNGEWIVNGIVQIK